MQNPVPAPVGNPAENPILVQNAILAKNPIPMQNQVTASISEGDLISFNENSSIHQPRESDDNKGSEPSDSEYDTTYEDSNVYFEKIIDPYINRITKAKNLNEGEVCDYYAFISKGYYAENELLDFFESIEEKIINVYKSELALKDELKHETIEMIKEDQINATIEKGYNEIIDQIENEAIQESG
ncbi:5542_t:CDS:2 [Ambispora gerdemannii]|uniref:5542_t:CDS:1 n=1 Tax=Ambispora gerdemannii TaxID=144530 RepID=A0A9N9DPI8_9GLOM|nr:5542_t:CDS:2 [Ambispora gerdemannii]